MIIKQIAKDYDLTVISITKSNIDKYAKKYDVEKNNLINNSYIIGDDILLGLYTNKELKIISFFHEIGHSVITDAFEKMVHYDEMLIEFQAWIEGLKIARKYKYKFSDKSFEYILKCVHSYYRGALNVYKK
jgi:hypothetical protein